MLQSPGSAAGAPVLSSAPDCTLWCQWGVGRRPGYGSGESRAKDLIKRARPERQTCAWLLRCVSGCRGLHRDDGLASRARGMEGLAQAWGLSVLAVMCPPGSAWHTGGGQRAACCKVGDAGRGAVQTLQVARIRRMPGECKFVQARTLKRRRAHTVRVCRAAALPKLWERSGRVVQVRHGRVASRSSSPAGCALGLCESHGRSRGVGPGATRFVVGAGCRMLRRPLATVRTGAGSRWTVSSGGGPPGVVFVTSCGTGSGSCRHMLASSATAVRPTRR